MSNKIYSCSYTLETLVEHLNKSLNLEDTLNEKVGSQRKLIYHLKQQLVDQKS